MENARNLPMVVERFGKKELLDYWEEIKKWHIEHPYHGVDRPYDFSKRIIAEVSRTPCGYYDDDPYEWEISIWVDKYGEIGNLVRCLVLYRTIEDAYHDAVEAFGLDNTVVCFGSP